MAAGIHIHPYGVISRDRYLRHFARGSRTPRAFNLAGVTDGLLQFIFALTSGLQATFLSQCETVPRPGWMVYRGTT